jgi:hypothetical protein
LVANPHLTQKKIDFPSPTLFSTASINQLESLSNAQIFRHHFDAIRDTCLLPRFLYPTHSAPYFATTTSFHNSSSWDKSFHLHFANKFILHPPCNSEFVLFGICTYDLWFSTGSINIIFKKICKLDRKV